MKFCKAGALASLKPSKPAEASKKLLVLSFLKDLMSTKKQIRSLLRLADVHRIHEADPEIYRHRTFESVIQV